MPRGCYPILIFGGILVLLGMGCVSEELPDLARLLCAAGLIAYVVSFGILYVATNMIENSFDVAIRYSSGCANLTLLYMPVLLVSIFLGHLALAPLGRRVVSPAASMGVGFLLAIGLAAGLGVVRLYLPVVARVQVPGSNYGTSDLYVDGKPAGKAPARLELPRGMHTFQVKEDGYLEGPVQKVAVFELTDVRLTLGTRLPALQVTYLNGDRLKLDDKPVPARPTRETLCKVELPVTLDTHKLVLEKSSGKRLQSLVKVTEKKLYRVDFTAAPKKKK